MTPRMPLPAHDGCFEFAGVGKPLGILVVGDSSAAGVGVERIEDSFAWFLPSLLNERSGRPVRVRIAGMNSATSAQIRDHVVPHVDPRDFDYVLLNIGTNDAKNFHTAGRFRAEFGTLLYSLKAKFPSAKLIWSGPLDLASVPALPSLLKFRLGIRSRLLNHIGVTLCAERGALAPASVWRAAPENFSADGFHASAAGYRE